MTQRLYYADAYTTTFDATVVAQASLEGKPAVILDSSYFYPTSGGQPYDTGWLGHARVLEVQARDDGELLHVVDRPLELGPIHGELDWPRRYDHMQQHSGQHLLSQLFYRLHGLETVSVHFGEELSTLDLDAAIVSRAQLDQVEVAARRLIAENRPIRARWVDDAAAAQLPLRRTPQVSGQIRIVEITEFDWSACGGTHVAATAEIGLVKLLRVERKRGQGRVHFQCGERAHQDYSRKHLLLTESAHLLDCAVDQVPEMVTKQQERLRTLEREVRTLQEQQQVAKAQALLSTARHVGTLRVVAQPCPDLDAVALKGLAQSLQQQERVIALLACTSGERATVIFARSADVAVDVSQLLRQSLGRFGGGGGGRVDFAQGGGPAQQLDQILSAAIEQVTGLRQLNDE